MKKIGIITYHFARNYGAVLQCFALQTFLEKKGYSVEIINYVNSIQYNNNDYYKHGFNIKKVIANVLLFPFFRVRKEKNKRFDDFNKKYLNLSEKVENLEELEELIKNKKYDYLISGSDQVFNPNIEDFDLAFLFPFETKAKKISYAASTGNANNNDINKIKKYILDFDKISIREKNDLVKFDGIEKKIFVTPDPVMILKKDDWTKEFNNDTNEKYLLCYFLHKKMFNKEFKTANKIAKSRNLKIINLNARYSFFSLKKGTIFNAGPEEFVNYIKNSSFVCTDSFHGTLFSIIFEKEFVCFDSRANKNDSRRKNLLEMCNHLDELYYIEDEFDINKKKMKKSSNFVEEQIEIANEFLGDLDD